MEPIKNVACPMSSLVSSLTGSVCNRSRKVNRKTFQAKTKTVLDCFLTIQMAVSNSC